MRRGLLPWLTGLQYRKYDLLNGRGSWDNYPHYDVLRALDSLRAYQARIPNGLTCRDEGYPVRAYE